MFPVIEFNKAAFKHGITEANILYAMRHPLHEQLLEAYINKWLIVGYDTERNLRAGLTYRRKQMARMTEEESDALDEEITNADITLKPGEDGIFTRQRKLLDALDRASADYIMTRALAANKMPLQILGEVIHEKIAASI